MSNLRQVSSKQVGSLRALLRILRRLGAISGFKIELDCVHRAYDEIDYSAIRSSMFNVLIEYPSDEDETFDRVNQMLERIFFSNSYIPTRFTEDFDD